LVISKVIVRVCSGIFLPSSKYSLKTTKNAAKNLAQYADNLNIINSYIKKYIAERKL